MCCLTTLLIDKITQIRTKTENVLRHNDEENFSFEMRGRNEIMDEKIHTQVSQFLIFTKHYMDHE